MQPNERPCSLSGRTEINQTISDCDFVSKWTNFFGAAQFFGFLFAPIAGAFIDGLEGYFERSIGITQRQVLCDFSSRPVVGPNLSAFVENYQKDKSM